MEVDFNNLRRKALHAYDSLVRKLNCRITDDDTTVAIDSDGRTVYKNWPVLVVEMDYIQEELDDLRDYIGGIAMVYQKDDPKFANVFEEVYPKGKQMEMFNQEPEEIEENNE